MAPVRHYSPDPPELHVWLFGVAFPILVLVVESLFWLSAGEGLDPLPTPLYAVMVALVPVILTGVLSVCRRRCARNPAWVLAGLGIVTGTSLFYILLYLPLLPFAVLLAPMTAGITLLSYAPLGALIVSLVLYRYYVKTVLPAPVNTRVLWLGLACSLLLLCLEDLKLTVVRTGVDWASAADAPTSWRGAKLLRYFGDRRLMLKEANVHDLSSPHPSGLLLQWFPYKSRVWKMDFRRAYYQATGVPYYLSEPPLYKSYVRQQRLDFGFDLGGAHSGPRVAGLSLTDSLLEINLSSDKALAQVDWTLEFANIADTKAPVHLAIQMPTGAAAHSASLRRDGHAREAVILAHRAASDAFFRNDVRDGKRLMVQGGVPDRLTVYTGEIAPSDAIKFTIGFHVPLQLLDEHTGYTVLPSFIRRNFSIHEERIHRVVVQADAPFELKVPNAGTASSSSKAHTLDFQLGDRQMVGPLPSLHMPVRLAARDVSAALIKSGWATHRKVQTPAEDLRHLAVVVDGSSALAGQGAAIARALTTLPAHYSLSLWVAGEQNIHLPLQPLTPEHKTRLTRTLGKVKFFGGQNNVQTLWAALLALEPYANAQLLWIAGPQHAASIRPRGSANPLLKMSWLPPVTFYGLASGFDSFPGLVYGEHPVHYLAHTFEVERDLTLWLAQFHQPQWQTVRQLDKTQPGSTSLLDKLTAESIRQLWADGEVERLRFTGHREAAEALALEHRLIQIGTAAVVTDLLSGDAD